jgi:hypothetical protein
MREPIQEWDKFGITPQPKALIESGDLQAALSGFAMREMLDYRIHGRHHSDVWTCGFGVVLWLMADHIGAARVWSKACDEALRGKFRYSSTGTFQSGLLLWFASVWLKDEDYREEANALFEKLLRKRQPVMGAGFSILLAKLLRGEINAAEVRDSFRKNPPQDQQSYEWLVLFYDGVRAYEQGDSDKTRQLWMQAKERTVTSVVFEYYILEHERKKL